MCSNGVGVDWECEFRRGRLKFALSDGFLVGFQRSDTVRGTFRRRLALRIQGGSDLIGMMSKFPANSQAVSECVGVYLGPLQYCRLRATATALRDSYSLLVLYGHCRAWILRCCRYESTGGFFSRLIDGSINRLKKNDTQLLRSCLYLRLYLSLYPSLVATPFSRFELTLGLLNIFDPREFIFLMLHGVEPPFDYTARSLSKPFRRAEIDNLLQNGDVPGQRRRPHNVNLLQGMVANGGVGLIRLLCRSSKDAHNSYWKHLLKRARQNALRKERARKRIVFDSDSDSGCGEGSDKPL